MLQAKKARVSLTQFSRLYGALSVHMGDEGAGLSSRVIPNGTVETMCRVGLTTSTLLEAVGAICRSYHAMLQGMTVRFAAQDGRFSMVITEIEPLKLRRHTTYEVLLLTAYAVIAWLVGRPPPLLEVKLPGAAPRRFLEFRALVAGPIQFEQDCAALSFAREEGAAPVVRVPSDLPKLLRRAPASLIETLMHQGSLTLAVRDRLYEALPEQMSIEELAGQLSMSSRTLHRKLIGEGTSFQKVKDEMRRDVAIHALTRTNVPLKKIAQRVGFRDQSSFQRAFAQWTGHSPGVTRARFARRS